MTPNEAKIEVIGAALFAAVALVLWIGRGLRKGYNNPHRQIETDEHGIYHDKK